MPSWLNQLLTTRVAWVSPTVYSSYTLKVSDPVYPVYPVQYRLPSVTGHTFCFPAQHFQGVSFFLDSLMKYQVHLRTKIAPSQSVRSRQQMCQTTVLGPLFYVG